MAIILLIFIFLRPFICSLAFPGLNFLYSSFLLIFLMAWVIIKGLPVKLPLLFRAALGMFCLGLAVSLIFSKNFLVSANELYKYAGGILLLAAAYGFNDKDRKTAINTIALSGLIISLLAIYQFFFSFQNTLNYLAKHNINYVFAEALIRRHRAFAPFITSNILASFLAMVIPLALVIKKRVWFLLLMFTALILTKSVGGMISLILALSIYYYLKSRIDKNKIAFFILLVIITAVILFIRANTFTEYTQPAFSSLRRWGYWKDTIDIIITHPLFGVGLGNFNLAVTRYAHNVFLQIWAEMGIIGLTGFIGIVFLTLAKGIKNIKPVSASDTGCPDNINAALIASCAAFLINNLFNFSFFLPEVTLVWWVILGLAASNIGK